MQPRWDSSTEELLRSYCDEAQTREALHRQAYYKFSRQNACFSLPVIVLSALSGSLQFLSKGYEKLESHIITGTAGLSIVVSIISSVSSYLKLGEMKSKHETAQVSWQGFHNTLKHELSLRRELRQPAAEFLSETQTSHRRLMEISPIIEQELITKTKKKIKSIAKKDFSVPNYLNGYSHTKVFRTEEDSFPDNSVAEDEVV